MEQEEPPARPTFASLLRALQVGKLRGFLYETNISHSDGQRPSDNLRARETNKQKAPNKLEKFGGAKCG